jgi:hypothetical protein
MKENARRPSRWRVSDHEGFLETQAFYIAIRYYDLLVLSVTPHNLAAPATESSDNLLQKPLLLNVSYLPG